MTAREAGRKDGRAGRCAPEWRRKHRHFRGRFADGVPSVLAFEPGVGTISRAALPEGVTDRQAYAQGYREGWASRGAAS